MYVDDGANVNPAWTKSIATSGNGADWETHQKIGIKKFTPTFIPNYNKSVINTNYKYVDKAEVTVEFTDDTSFSFDVQGVQNQATWNTGAASVKDGLNQAISDLTGWL